MQSEGLVMQLYTDVLLCSPIKKKKHTAQREWRSTKDKSCLVKKFFWTCEESLTDTGRSAKQIKKKKKTPWKAELVTAVDSFHHF